MRRTVAGLVLGLVLVIGTGQARSEPAFRDTDRCAALVDLVLQQYDRAYAAEEALYASPRHVRAAQAKLLRIDATWERMWTYAQSCSDAPWH